MMNSDKDVWPPSPTYGVGKDAVAPPVIAKWVILIGSSSMSLSLGALSLLLLMITLVFQDTHDYMPTSFLPEIGLGDTGLALSGFVCGIFGRRTPGGRIGIAVSAVVLCILGFAILFDLLQRNVI